MKAMFALMRQEIVERRLLAAAGLLLGLLPLGMPFLPNVSRQPVADLRGGAALILAGLLSAALALILGATVVGRDLGERRLGFFFARPLPGWTIWGGKMAAALLLAWGAGFLVLLPVLLLGDLGRAELWTLVGVGAVAVLGVVPLAHAVGILLRARSAWLLLDLIGLLAFAVAAYSVLTSLGRAGAMAAFEAVAWGLGAALFAALMAASLLQVARGRTDLRRGHRALSLALWGGLLAAVLLSTAAARWVIAAPLSSLEQIELTAPAPAGSWVAVSGLAAHRGDYRPAFLVDLANGRSRRLPLITQGGNWWQPPLFSADGRRAVWVEVGRSGYETRSADLREGEVAVQSTLPFEGLGNHSKLSPSGGLLAVVGRGRILIQEVPSGRLVASTHLRAFGPKVDVRFLQNPERLRITEMTGPTNDAWAIDVRDLPVAGGPAIPVGRLSGLDVERQVWVPWINERVSPDGSRLQVRQGGNLELWDIVSSEVIAAVPAGTDGAFLPDGRWIAIATSSGQSRIHLFSPGGAELRRLQVPGRVVLGALVAPDLLAAHRGETAEREALLLDLRTGGVRSLGHGLVPAAGPETRPGALTARLFGRNGTELLLLDPATGAWHPVPLAEQ